MAIVTTPIHGRERRAARLGGLAALVLVILAVAMGWPWGWPDLRGRHPDRPGGSSGAGPFVGASIEEAPDAAEGAEDDEAVATAEEPAVDVDAGHGKTRRTPQAEQWLAFINEVERQIDAAMARARESVVALEYTPGRGPSGRRRIASGVVINAGGEVLSVRIDPPPEEPASTSTRREEGPAPAPIMARDYLGRRHAARWVASDPHTGLTLLRVAPRAVRPIRPAKGGPKLGGQVFVLGHPFGLGDSIHRGNVAGLDRVLELAAGQQLGGLIQVHVPLYPGDSGAAVVDGRGRWLGLIRGGLAARGHGRAVPTQDVGPTDARGTPGDEAGDDADDPDAIAPEPDTAFGFAIPTHDALWVAAQLRSYGRVDRAYLGVRLEPPPVSERPLAAAASDVSASGGAPGSWRGSGAERPETESPASDGPDSEPVSCDGARILDVVVDTPAARAGLRPRDRIVAVDGQAIRSRNDLIDRLDRIPARQEIVVTVVRDGESGPRRLDLPLRTASRSNRPDPGPGRSSYPAATGDGPRAPESSPDRSTPTAEASASKEAPPGREPADDPGEAPRPGAPEKPADRTGSAPPAADGPGSIDELKLTLPRAVVERIEHLERRIDELEHHRTGSDARARDEHLTTPEAQKHRD